jgi:hypothetical protein
MLLPVPGPHLGGLAGDLLGRRVDEAVELDLADWTVPAQRQADRGADDAGLGQECRRGRITGAV